jgi:serine/threonine protein kinase
LDRVGHVKLCDFGFARTTDGDGRCYTNLGTPHYLAPEQLDIHSKAGYTNIVDWWSFGCLLFSLMGGEPPFGNSEDTRYQVYLRVMKSKYKMPSFFPSTAKSLFKKMFIANAKNRLASAEALKKHNWFSDAKWDQTKKKETPPPFKPQVQKNGKNNFSKIKIRKMDDGEAADIIAEKSHYFNDF